MEKAKVNFVKFENNDVIATSGGFNVNSMYIWANGSLLSSYDISNPMSVTKEGRTFVVQPYYDSNFDGTVISQLFSDGVYYLSIGGNDRYPELQAVFYDENHVPAGWDRTTETTAQTWADILKWLEQ